MSALLHPKPLLFTKQQLEAIELIAEFLDPSNPAQTFVMDGAAGTGKTTVLENVYRTYSPMRLCAYTGKAANNLNIRLGSPVATTLHKLLYKLEGEAYDLRTKRIQPVYSTLPIKLYGQRVALDEYSLVNEQHGKNLERTHAKLLVAGDSFQLPPVEGKPWIKSYDVQLTEITRQAQDSGIIRQLHNIRYSKKGLIQEDSGVEIVDLLSHDQMMEVDVILCYTNPRRHKFNRIKRQLNGYPVDKAVKGELVVALQNNEEYGLYNGSTYRVARTFDLNHDKKLWLDMDNGVTVGLPRVAFVPTNQDIYYFTPKERKYYTGIFDFGYCQTVHKSQGSEWPKVALVDDYTSGSATVQLWNWRSWQYTGVSRGKELVIFRRLR